MGQKRVLGKLWKIVLLPTIVVFGVLMTLAGMKAYSIDPAFAAYVKQYSKSYPSSTEFAYRQSVFLDNLSKIEAFNSQSLSFSLALNEFSDLTEAENQATGLPNYDFALQTAEINYRPLKSAQTAVDWTEQGVVTEVKNERGCQTSWVFSAIAAAESLYAIQNNKDQLEFSEQAVLDCCPVNLAPCVDGLPQDAFSCMKQFGIALEAVYPYEAEHYMCHEFNSSFEIGGSAPITNSAVDMMQSLDTNPIVVSLDATAFEFLHYREGVFTSTNCKTNAPNHSMLVVGYNSTSTPPYFKAKNSWGSQWGEAGYVRVEMSLQAGPGVCGIQASPLMPLRKT